MHCSSFPNNDSGWCDDSSSNNRLCAGGESVVRSAPPCRIPGWYQLLARTGGMRGWEQRTGHGDGQKMGTAWGRRWEISQGRGAEAVGCGAQVWGQSMKQSQVFTVITSAFLQESVFISQMAGQLRGTTAPSPLLQGGTSYKTERNGKPKLLPQTLSPKHRTPPRHILSASSLSSPHNPNKKHYCMFS